MWLTQLYLVASRCDTMKLQSCPNAMTFGQVYFWHVHASHHHPKMVISSFCNSRRLSSHGELQNQPRQKALCSKALGLWLGDPRYLFCSYCLSIKHLPLAKNFNEHGSVNRPPSPLVGQTRIITWAVLTAVQSLYAEEPDVYLDELCTFLAVEHNIIVSTSTLPRNLIEAGLTRKLLHKLAIERDEILRDEWRQSLREDYIGDGSEFVCLDETSKNKHTFG